MSGKIQNNLANSAGPDEIAYNEPSPDSTSFANICISVHGVEMVQYASFKRFNSPLF